MSISSPTQNQSKMDLFHANFLYRWLDPALYQKWSDALDEVDLFIHQSASLSYYSPFIIWDFKVRDGRCDQMRIGRQVVGAFDKRGIEHPLGLERSLEEKEHLNLTLGPPHKLPLEEMRHSLEHLMEFFHSQTSKAELANLDLYRLVLNERISYEAFEIEATFFCLDFCLDFCLEK